MAVRPIVLYDSNPEILRRRSEPVKFGVGKVQELIADLKDTLLHHSNGIGLAAPQIGVHGRVIVVRFSGKSDGSAEGEFGPPIAVVNPVVVEKGRERLDSDGCLSIPGVYAETVRPHFMRLRGLDERGQALEWTLDGFDAVEVHHEVDHLDGILFIDRIDEPIEMLRPADARKRS